MGKKELTDTLEGRVVVVLPTLNEEQGIGTVLEDIARLGKGSWQALVADGGSSDRTVEIAQMHGARVLQIQERGKGRALREVFEKVDSDYLIVMDGDASYPVDAIPLLLQRLQDCDVVIGSRFKGTIASGAMTPVNKLGNQGLTLLGSLLYGANVTDVCSGMWAFGRAAYKGMHLHATHFEVEANFFVEAAKKRFKICEVPIPYTKRAGEAKLRVSDGIAIGWFLIRNRMR